MRRILRVYRALSRASASGARRAATPARSSAGSRSSTFRRRSKSRSATGCCTTRGGRASRPKARRELVRYGFDTSASIGSSASRIPDNIASQRVLMKAGLADAGWGRYYGAAAAPVRGDAIRSRDRRADGPPRARASGLVPLDAQVLLAHVLGRDRAWLVAHATTRCRAPRPTRSSRSRSAAATASRSPTSRACANSGDLPLAVSPDVLIPRPETETLVELALARLPRDRDVARARPRHRHRGAIALALAHERPRAQVLATDVSADGARRRARQRAAARRSPTSSSCSRTGTRALPRWRAFDLIAAQSALRRGARSASARRRRALRAARGADAGRRRPRRRCARSSPARATHLVAGGSLVVEHGYDQSEAVRALFADAGFADIVAARDLAGIARVVAGDALSARRRRRLALRGGFGSAGAGRRPSIRWRTASTGWREHHPRAGVAHDLTRRRSRSAAL